MPDSLLIWGASGHGKVVLDVARATGMFRRIVFVDDDSVKARSGYCGCEVISGAAGLREYVEDYLFVIAVGENHARAYCFQRALDSGLTPAVIVHPSAIISPSAAVGRGTVVMPGAVVNAEARLGENCIVNTGAIVEHDCSIGDSVHISPRAVLGGAAAVGNLAHVGIGAVVLPGASVGERAVVGAGAVVLKEAPARCTVIGVPARALSYA